jgi:DNA repair exonuclease SbcCD nuclease subunit
MRNFLIILVTLGFFINQSVQAQQLTKTQKRALKKEIRTYKKNPEKWVKMQNQHQDKVKELSDEIARLNAQLKTAELTSEQLAEQLKLEQLRFVELEKTIPSTELPEGTVYQVQMGFYQYLDLVSFNDKLKTVRAEEIDGKKRYVIGHFDNLLDAVQFSNDIKRIGVSDAFVTEYIDGKRNMNFDAYEGLGE